MAKQGCSSREFEDEMSALESSLGETGYRGGIQSINDIYTWQHIELKFNL